MPIALRGLLLGLLVGLAGCAALTSRVGDRLGHDLAAGIRNQDDPATVAAGLPAYLLLLDGMIEGQPESAGLLRGAADLYGLYAGSFVDDNARAQRLSARGFDYARRAVCAADRALCKALDGPVDTFQQRVETAQKKQLPLLYTLAASWAGYIQAHSADFKAIAALPKAQALLERVIALDPTHDRGMPYAYLGVLHSLRPAAVGGQPERGREYFEQAIARSAGANLMAKTLYAQFYARLMFERELHDRLLSEVLAADPRLPGWTLSNVLAQQRATQLQSSAAEFF